MHRVSEQILCWQTPSIQVAALLCSLNRCLYTALECHFHVALPSAGHLRLYLNAGSSELYYSQGITFFLSFFF